MKEQERIDKIIDALNREYGREVPVFLNHESPWQLLVATILSAQCTDERVNIVTEKLFKKYKTVEDFAEMEHKELERYIYSTGFYRNKAKNIIGSAKRVLEEYDSQVPSDIDELLTLPGVGRKTANVIRSNIFEIPSIVVDTHVKRISNRLGIVNEEDPEKIEFQLMDKLDEGQWILYNTQLITLGRTICTARNPRCNQCFLKEWCPSSNKNDNKA